MHSGTSIAFGNAVFYGSKRLTRCDIVRGSTANEKDDPATEGASEEEDENEDSKGGGDDNEARKAQLRRVLKRMLASDRKFGAFIATMFESGHFELKGLAQREIQLLAKMAIKSERMQKVLLELSTARAPVFVMMLDGYMNLALVASFIYASINFLQGQPNKSANIAILCIATYFLLREALQLLSGEFLFYFWNFWNAIDLMRGLLVIISSIFMLASPQSESVSDGMRYLLLCTGVFVVGELILFLRATVLPYAEFVGGFITIFRKLLPFLVVSFLLLLAFAYMYFTTEGFGHGSDGCSPTEDVDFCSLSGSMLTTVSFFFTGPTETKTWLDMVFGVVIVVVLLNVVIAIVSDAWAESIEKGRELFWKYRISLVEEVESLVSWISNCCCCCPVKDPVPSFLSTIATWVDSLGNRSVFDTVDWESEPYKEAKSMYTPYMIFVELDGDIDASPEDDEDNFLVGLFEFLTNSFSPEDREKLQMMGSFQRDWYWAKQPREDKDFRFFEPPTKSEVITRFLLYLLLFPLGFLSCGLLWPNRVRQHVFGTTGTTHDEDVLTESTLDLKLEEVERRLGSKFDAKYQSLEARLDRVIALLEDLPKRDDQ